MLPPFLPQHLAEHLPAFLRKPSWVNRAGRVDRSACMEIRAAELWRSIDPMHWRNRRTSTGLLAVTEISIDAHLVLDLHDARLPCKLIGDLRTPKSNAMKHENDPPPNQRRKKLHPHEQRWIALPDLNECYYSNPNRGATRTKVPALSVAGPPPYDRPWSQTIRIERWQRGTKSSAGLVASHHAKDFEPQSSRSSQRRKLNSQSNGSRNSNPPPSQSSIVNRQSSIPSPPRHRHYLICPACEGRVCKLFMVLATEQELIDAEIAEGCVRLLNARLAASHQTASAELMQQRAALINRYGPLFRDRRLICKTCLKLRYGEVKKSRLPFDSVAGARLRADRRVERDREDERRRADEVTQAWAGVLHMFPPGRLEARGKELEAWRKKKAKRERANARQRERRATKRVHSQNV